MSEYSKPSLRQSENGRYSHLPDRSPLPIFKKVLCFLLCSRIIHHHNQITCLPVIALTRFYCMVERRQ
jgi:hypothetical protein